MNPDTRCYVAADYSQLESWLTAHFTGDTVMQAELDEQLVGGPKIHARNAELIYGDTHGVTTDNARDVKVSFQGRRVPAYDAGKRSGHGFNYGMGVNHMAKLYWIAKVEAQRVIELFSDKYAITVRERQRWADEVFGVYEFGCPLCEFKTSVANVNCPTCSKPKNVVRTRFLRVVQAAAKVLYTPFGRRRIYLGRRAQAENAVASQRAQSGGAEVWYNGALRLIGYDPDDEKEVWPTPTNGQFWSPRLMTYGELYAPYETFLATGTYDSYLIETTYRQAEEVLEWLLWTMEQPVKELDGRRFPAEGSIGFNWRDFDADANPKGLKEQTRAAFTAANPYDQNGTRPLPSVPPVSGHRVRHVPKRDWTKGIPRWSPGRTGGK